MPNLLIERPKTPGELMRNASQRTGMLPNHRNSTLMNLTPEWKQTVIPTRESSKSSDSKLNDVTSPFLPSRAPRRKYLLQHDDSMRDLEAIYESHKYESLFVQCTNKYTDLINKEGYRLRGAMSAPTVDFLNARFRWMGAKTKKPMESLIKELSRDVVQYGRGFLVKQRIDPSISMRIGGKVLKTATNLHGDEKLGVIGGYFRADPLSFQPRYEDNTGKLIGWQQVVPGKDPKKFGLEEVLHFANSPSNDEDLGKSMYSPLMDDIRELRQMEEYIIQLIYKHLYPYIHHEIPDNTDNGHGVEEDIKESVTSHVNVAPDGMIITPAGHKIHAIETVNATLNASPYLKHMLQRILMGLGLSEAIMGLGTAATGMSDMLTAQMHDRVKSLQQDLEWGITLKIVQELLAEAGFDPINNPKDYVGLEFNEIEIESVIRIENHATDLYNNGGIDQDELRNRLGLNPLTDRQRELLQLNQEKIPLIEAQVRAQMQADMKVAAHANGLQKDLATHQAGIAKDQATHQGNIAAKAAKDGAALSATGKPAPAAPPAPASLRAPKMAARGATLNLNPARSPAANAVANKNNPANQHGKRGAPRFSKSPAAGAASKKTPQSAK